MISPASLSTRAHRLLTWQWNNKTWKSILCKSLEVRNEWFPRLSVGGDTQSAPLKSAAACIHRFHPRAAHGWILYVHYERPGTRQGDGPAQRQSTTSNEHGRLDYIFRRADSGDCSRRSHCVLHRHRVGIRTRVF